MVLAPEGGVEAPLPPCSCAPTWTTGGTGGGAASGHPPGWKVPAMEEWSVGWAPTRPWGGGAGAGTPWASALPWCGAHDHSASEYPLSEWPAPWRGASPWWTGAAWGRCWWGGPAGMGALGPSCEAEAADQGGADALPCAAVPAWMKATGGRSQMSASETPRWTAAKAAGESAGWKEVRYPCDVRSDSVRIFAYEEFWKNS